MKESSPERLETLLDRYFDGEIDAESRRQLDAALAGSPEARARFWERARLEDSLEVLGRQRRGEAVTPIPGPPRRRWLAACGWAAAAAILLAWLAQTRFRDAGPAAVPALAEAGRKEEETISRQGYPVALLSRLVGVSSAERYLAGQTLAAGEEVAFEAGLMEIVLYSGATVAIEGPARFVPRGDLEIEVFEGSVQADVPESAIGFRMLLPDGVVTDFGTSFDLKVEKDRTSRVQVLDGEIELSSSGSDRPAKRMFQGDAMGRSDSGELEALDFLPLQVVDSLETRVGERTRSQLERWAATCEEVAADADLVVHFSLAPEEKGKRVVMNRAVKRETPRSGTVISADWSEGRWPGKPALSFRRPADRLRVDIPGEFPAATFVAWVRIDGLPRQYNGLFFSEYGVEGEVHWQFSSDGRYLFGVRPKGVEGIVRFHRAFSKPVISPWEFGSWRMLATTYDATNREVVHFVDAGKVSRTELAESVPLRFGRATLGNFFDPLAEKHSEDPQLVEGWSFRNWTGALDEFMLFSRVLSDGELDGLFQAGRTD